MIERMDTFHKLLYIFLLLILPLILYMVNARTGRAAQMFLGALPVLAVYPFLQKFFTKGLVLGSVKG